MKRVEGWDDWDYRAQIALTAAFAIAMNPTSHIANRLAALKLLLEYTRAEALFEVLKRSSGEDRRPGSNRTALDDHRMAGAAG